MHTYACSLFLSALSLSSLPLTPFVLSLFHTSSFLQLSFCVSFSVALLLSRSPSVMLTSAEVIISGRLGVKVCYDKHAAVVINFE